jgi:hypothetical protein
MKFEEEINNYHKERKDFIEKSFDYSCDNLIEKARSGVYKDTPENRKLGRVGMKYGGKKEKPTKNIKKEDHKGEPLSYKLSEDHEYFVRFSDHIEEDLKRGWSSWNFGGDGVEAESAYDLGNEIKEIKENLDEGEETEYSISGFDILIDENIKIDIDYDSVSINNGEYEIKELYDGYWVLVDNVNSPGELSSHKVDDDDLDDMDNLGELVNYVESKESKFDGTGDGESFDASEARVVYSKGNMHILEVG